MTDPKPTRGYGLLEKFLSKKRVKMAHRLIPPWTVKKRILDIGSGSYPLFLLKTDFEERYGLDKVARPEATEIFRKQKVFLTFYDVENDDILPFADGFFSVVSMLAVIEHIELKKMMRLTNEIYRVLCPNGTFIITTPAPWTENILKLMAKLHLISAIELQEHKWLATRSLISHILQEANFPKDKLRFGYFEAFLNTWATATK